MKFKLPRLRLANSMVRGRKLSRAFVDLHRAWLAGARQGAGERRPASGQGLFAAGRYRGAAGTMAYKLYTPAGFQGERLPVVVMLHGCGQRPDDFAEATRMNLLADELRLLVVYPAQSRAANASRCWNWFEAAHQRRGEGEPALIAGITRKLLGRDGGVGRAYVAGLSAGGAMAAVMGATYPELYAAIGVHSGLAHESAHDLASALRAMRGGSARIHQAGLESGRALPMIAFHGDADATVHASNSRIAPRGKAREHTEKGERNGRWFTRSIQFDPQGRPAAERWIVHGAGHAWSGGSGGSYSDSRGPDASREMLRFFLQHP
jgi:poly(hydroxyalkanoate) depolymerase family esterase